MTVADRMTENQSGNTEPAAFGKFIDASWPDAGGDRLGRMRLRAMFSC